MAWKRRKKVLTRSFPDLEFVPPGRSAWDCTLSCLAYGMRMDMPGAVPDLNAWATRHGVPGSESYARLRDAAMVLWHGTSRERADKIVEHGLFHKKGLWTARHPAVPHMFCRRRSEHSGTEGAVVCLVLDKSQLLEGLDYEVEPNENVVRFQHGLPPEVVEYVLVREEIRFVGTERASDLGPWPKARFKRYSGQWRPVQKAPVRFSESESFSTLTDYERLCISKLLRELNAVTPLEVLSVLFSLVDPWESLRHDDIVDMLHSMSSLIRRIGRWRVFLPNQELQATRRLGDYRHQAG
jgi:hypothetical protein